MLKLKNTLSAVVCTVAALTSLNALAVDKSAIAEAVAAQLNASKNLNAEIQNIERSHTPILVDTILAPKHSLKAMDIGSTTEMWLYLPVDRALSDDMSDLVVAFPPSGNEDSWTAVEGYTLSGESISLDVHNAPSVPVIVIDDHGYYAMKDNVKQLNTLLQASGLQQKTEQPVLSLSAKETATTAGFDSSKLTKIRLEDDHDSWVKGAAEVYALVTGVLSQNEPQVLAVEMPYLDNDKTDYYPNQIVINWSAYDYRVVDMLLYESDNGTNYKSLVQALVTAIGAAGSLAGWAPSVAVAEITNRVITAMPDSWYADDDDFIDACYTIERGVTYNGTKCSANNATFSMEPFFVEPN